MAESSSDVEMGTDTVGGLETALLKPTRASRQKVKETPIEEKKTSQKRRKQAESQNEVEAIEPNLELTEENKASKKEMLSIESGVLLDDILKQ